MTLIEERDLTYEERATFGECPDCHMPHGMRCSVTQKFHAWAYKPEASTIKVHLARFNAAPTKRRVYYGD